MRPEPKKDPDRLETDITISVLPLRLNVDQLAIDFLITFFSSFAEKSDEEEQDYEQLDEEEGEGEEKKEEKENEDDKEEEEEAQVNIKVKNNADIYFQKFSFQN